MQTFKSYIADKLIGKRLHFKCDCLLGMDYVGIIQDYEFILNEIIFIVDVNGKIVRIGENHPNLYVEEA